MTTLTEVFPSFFLSCKANARVKPAKIRHEPHSSQLCCSMYFFVLFCVLSLCTCVLNNCQRVATQLQLNIYHIICPVLNVSVRNAVSIIAHLAVHSARQ
jgi:uncharacterized membrane protein